MIPLRVAAFLACLGIAGALAPASAANAAPGPTPTPTAAASPSPSPTAPPTPAETHLQAEVTALEQQILALQLQSAPFQLQAVQAQQRVATLQQQLAAAQLELAGANVRVAETTGRLQALQPVLAADREQLGALILGSYKITTDGTALTAVLSSQSLAQGLDRLLSYQQVTDGMETLLLRVRGEVQELADLQLQQHQQQQQITAQVSSVQALQAQATQDEATYQRKAVRLTGRAAALTQQLDVLLRQLAALEGVQIANVDVSGGNVGSVAGGLPAFAFGPRLDDFPWGQCTWYVASLRDVTWSGNAWEWAAAAAAAGEAEGLVPKPGAIVVFGRGNGYSDIGHVAYVETVTGPTSFVVDEANVYGLGVVDRRAVASLNDVEAFIY